ncbi:hypothetical protein AYL99_04087 [Fonsecaea erecta]|uniref:Methyltransferase domain-containing protein n=1 Tax=Fonsecaea erecta TaxID=1367422 RepID=A0A178ZPX8_9EURO|nr:hypothetical protein AYL99_04087 [Fonsecaea erecta]OAP61884.1 hypothetical protein AYL99_04087 [Fonsecaea erecta]
MSLPEEHDPAPNPDFEPDETQDAAEDVDSALGDDDDLLSTSSLTSSVFDYIQEHGRTYNAYGERTYVLPNDEMELDRLDLQHHLLKMTFNDRLSTCGVEKRRELHHVLDIGTGTGIWSVEFGDLHPEAIVLGVDVSPVQPIYVPPNVRFEVMDVGQQWVFSYQFDFIFSRFMTGAIADWRQFIQQSYENLAPGAMLEVQDISFHLGCDDGTLPPDSALAKWAAYMLEASRQLGCPLDSVESVREIMIETGFVDVVETPYMWPMSPWKKKDPTLKTIGVWTYHNFTASLSGISLALFTRGLGWTTEELEAFLIDVRKDMRNTRYHAFWPIYTISGTKPG